MDAIRRASEAAAAQQQRFPGWVLVGFPETAAQAKMLEYELTG